MRNDRYGAVEGEAWLYRDLILQDRTTGGMPQGVARDCKSLVLRDMLGSIPRLPTKQIAVTEECVKGNRKPGQANTVFDSQRCDIKFQLGVS